MNKPKIGVVGVGHLGTLHTKLLNEIESCELIGIFDLDFNKAEQVAAQINTSAYQSLEELFNKINLVVIATTTSSHYQVVKKALDYGLHVFVEKPITSKISEAEELVRTADKLNLILQVGHVERFNPALISLEKYNLNPLFVQTDRLAQFNPRGTDVAVVLDLMIHDIDIILSLIKSEVKNIYASGVSVVSDTIDIANARLEFENGAVANVTASRISQKKMRKMRIFQRDGYISLDFITGVSEVYRLISPHEMKEGHYITFGEMGIGDKKKLVVYEQPEIKEINALKYELELFIDAAVYRKKPVVSGYDGLRALKVAEMIINKINDSKVFFA
ncbi:Gfo/Idh/MocA family oxidoreductase [Melioribacteraceae bacterium 4301-Me]|uniref:Gfo/Idh/MocA family oxidoreductase n=1 Tax=Pyranulibacter aquaticus TaxID=3163344 RepID=UPI003596E620